jgi:predicted HicB family RNase H-like nuclease
MNRKTKKAAGIKQMTIRVPAEVHRLLKVKAAEDGQTVSGIAIALLQGYLKGKGCP